MRALILGGAGFIGLHLARGLVSRGHEVTIVDDFSRGRRDAELEAVRANDRVRIVSADLTEPANYAALPHGWVMPIVHAQPPARSSTGPLQSLSTPSQSSIAGRTSPMQAPNMPLAHFCWPPWHGPTPSVPSCWSTRPGW